MLTVQRDSDLVVTGVMNPVKANVIGDVGHFIHPQGCGGLDCQRLGFSGFVFWGMVDGFVQLSSQNLHNAVGVGVVVDGRTLSRVPYQKKLWKLVKPSGKDTLFQLTMLAL